MPTTNANCNNPNQNKSQTGPSAPTSVAAPFQSSGFAQSPSGSPAGASDGSTAYTCGDPLIGFTDNTGGAFPHEIYDGDNLTGTLVATVPAGTTSATVTGLSGTVTLNVYAVDGTTYSSALSIGPISTSACSVGTGIQYHGSLGAVIYDIASMGESALSVNGIFSSVTCVAGGEAYMAGLNDFYHINTASSTVITTVNGWTGVGLMFAAKEDNSEYYIYTSSARLVTIDPIAGTFTESAIPFLGSVPSPSDRDGFMEKGGRLYFTRNNGGSQYDFAYVDVSTGATTVVATHSGNGFAIRDYDDSRDYVYIKNGSQVVKLRVSDGNQEWSYSQPSGWGLGTPVEGDGDGFVYVSRSNTGQMVLEQLSNATGSVVTSQTYSGSAYPAISVAFLNGFIYAMAIGGGSFYQIDSNNLTSTILHTTSINSNGSVQVC